MADYKPAQLGGMEGFKGYIPIVKPNVSAVQAMAPGYSKIMEWPDPLPAKDILAKMPGGKLSSIPSMQQMTYEAFQYTPQGMGVYARQPLMDPAKKIGWDPNKKSVRSFSTDLSIIDPLGSIENVTGEFFGLQTALIGSGGSVADPMNWIGERNIGFENYPTRLMDYAFSTVPMIAMHLMGMNTKSSIPRNVDGEGFFPFENDPNYWAGMSNWQGTKRPPTDDELMNEAKAQASAVSMSPSLLVPALYERYKWGRDLMVHAYTSGNERVDYIAKKQLEEVIKIIRAGTTGTIPLFKNAKGEQVGPISFANSLPGLQQQLLGGVNQLVRSAVTLIPGIGTPLADILMPVSDETEKLWTSLTPDQRRSLMADASMTTMMTDVVVTLPLLSGAGSLASALKAGAGGGDFMAWAAASGMVKDASMVAKGMSAADEIAAITKGWSVGRATFNVAKQVTYDLAGIAPRASQGAIAGFGRMTLVMDRLMAVGMASMLANWGLESFVPGYAEAVGYDIDNSRPFSESATAGLLNNIGYFSSATAGFNTMQRMTRSIPKYTGKAIGKTGVLGNPEQRFFSTHLGGAQRVRESQQVWGRPDGAVPTDPDFNIPVMATADSGLEHMVQNMELERVTREVINDPDLAALPIEQRVELANEDLLNSLTNTADRKATLGGLLNHLGSETSFVDDLVLSDAKRVAQNAQAKAAREVDDRIASWLSRLYSETWWQRQFRSLGIPMSPGRPVADYKGWMRSAAQRTGWTFNEAKAVELWGDDVTAWRQAANLFHAKEFMMTNAELIEAAKISPVEGLLAHPEDYFLMRADHLFTDRADFLRAAIKQMGTDTPLLPGGEEEVRALAAREIRTTQELDEWWARLRKKQGLSDDLVARSEGIRDEPVRPEDVDLDALVEYIEESYSTLPGRHPINSLDPMTADYPINALARRLGQEKMYAVAYKPKDAIIAYRPVERTLAYRASKNAPDGYDIAAPVGVRAALDAIADTQLHVSMNAPAVLAEGLRSRRELIEMSGDELMHHGSSTVWYQFDPQLASETSLVGKGLYLTSSHRVGVSYNYGGSQGMVKEFRIPADARIWDAEAPMTDEFFDLIAADIAKGHAGRLWKAADKARVESGDMLDPDAMLSTGGEWDAGLEVMAQGGGPAGGRESYIDSVVNGDAIADYQHHFKNAINDILFDAGYEGLTHVGGRNIGGLGEHKVYVLFDPDATLQRAGTLGTGAGGSAADAGRDVSLVVNEARAAVIEERYKLAIRAARGEATIDEIVDHFTAARASQGQSAEAAWRDMWDEVSRANRGGSAFDRAIADATGMPVQAYFTPNNRWEFVKILDNFYNPGLNPPFWRGRQEADRLAAMGDLVSILDNSLEKGGPLKFPMDVAGQAYDPAGWARYSAGITQRASQLAKLDPANVGTVRVARRMEAVQLDPADIPRSPQDPTRAESLDQWIDRLWRGVNEDGIPMEPRDSYFVRVSGNVYDEGMRTGTFAPESSWDRIAARTWDEFAGTPQGSYANEAYVLEMEKGLVTTDGAIYTRQFMEAPKASIKRVWTADANGEMRLTYERGGGPLGEGDFYRTGRGPAEIRANSNHLWVVDPKATARHAGWTDDTPQPLDNQWEQPWSGVVEDPTAGAEPVYSHVSYVRLKDGTIVKAPFRDYPMNPGNIYLGNRTLLGRKYDSIFQGVRSWRMAEHHLAQMARSFGGRYGFTPAQVELFKDRVEAYARSTGFSGIGGAGEIKITPFANARLRSNEVNAIGEKIFGKGKVKNLVTGEMEDLDYAQMFADAHQQAWTLNFTSGIISRVKNFDLLSIGTGSTWVADWLIPVLRFKASPVFRVSELLESKVFNSMRGVNVSEEERKVYVDAGLHPNPNLLSSDFGTEPLLESMFSPGQNQAASQTMAGVHGLDDLVAGEGTTGVASSYVIWRDVNDLLSRKGLSGLKDDIKDPARYKNGLMFDQQIESVRRELPIIIKARDPRAYKILSEDLKVPDDQMARFIAEDRVLYGKWQHGKISFEELLAHSNKFIKKEADEVEEAALRAMYETEDWKVIDTMMRVASMSAQAEAFGTHFFGTYRSALERSINHPLLGIYPASWMYKAAKEWGKFLYDNRTFGHGALRLGMYPAVAMNELIKNINMTVAMNTGQGWQDWLDNGPARNWLFLWNLLLPGDWSSLPLPLARPLRTIYRNLQAGNWEGLAPWNLAADTLMGPQGRGGIGIIRDLNLAARGLYDIAEYAAGDKPGQLDNLANGLSIDGHMKAPPRYSELLNWPDAMAPVNPPP